MVPSSYQVKILIGAKNSKSPCLLCPSSLLTQFTSVVMLMWSLKHMLNPSVPPYSSSIRPSVQAPITPTWATAITSHPNQFPTYSSARLCSQAFLQGHFPSCIHLSFFTHKLGNDVSLFATQKYFHCSLYKTHTSLCPWGPWPTSPSSSSFSHVLPACFSSLRGQPGLLAA